MTRTADQVGLEPVREQEQVLVEAARQLDPRMFRQVTPSTSATAWTRTAP